MGQYDHHWFPATRQILRIADLYLDPQGHIKYEHLQNMKEDYAIRAVDRPLINVAMTFDVKVISMFKITFCYLHHIAKHCGKCEHPRLKMKEKFVLRG